MPKLHSLQLRCPDPAAQAHFYCDLLGMRRREDGTLGYADTEAGLQFSTGAGDYTPSRDSVYWKIAIAVPDIELACDQLREKGVEVDGPRQVADIGYLAHFADPCGFQIELIDHHFQGDSKAEPVDSQLLGGGPHLNLITLRSHDIELASQTADKAGLTLHCVIPAPDFGFTLYFYGYGSERPPNPDPHAIENRTWSYRQRETLLEIVHRPQDAPMQHVVATASGYGGVTVSGLPGTLRDPHLQLSAGDTVKNTES